MFMYMHLYVNTPYVYTHVCIYHIYHGPHLLLAVGIWWTLDSLAFISVPFVVRGLYLVNVYKTMYNRTIFYSVFCLDILDVVILALGLCTESMLAMTLS